MKKFVCAFLMALFLINSISLFGFSALAANSDDAITVVYMKDGKETVLGNYSKLSLAAEAVGSLYEGLLNGSIPDSAEDADTNNSNELYVAAGSPVIKINCDIVGDSVCPDWVIDGYDQNNVPTIVIDGAKSETENYTVTCDDITLFDRLAFYNLTVRNTDMIFNRTNTSKAKLDNNIRWNGNIDTNVTSNPRIPGESFTVFENCLIDQNSSIAKASGEGGLFKMNGFKKPVSGVDQVKDDIYNLTLKDCSVFSDSAVGLQVHWGADANICLENTSWTMDGVAGNGNNNDCILKCYEAGNVYMKLDGRSKLIGARSEGCQTIALFRSLPSMAGSVKYELDEDAELYMNNTATNSLKEQHFIATGAKTVIVDRGALFRLSESSVKSCAATLPKNEAYTTFIGVDAVYAAGNIVAKAGNYISPNCIADAIGMLDGASVRSEPDEYGLRFTAFISKQFIETLPDDTEFGMVIFPASSSSADPANDPKATVIKASKFLDGDDSDSLIFYGAKFFEDISDVKSVCNAAYTAKAYYTVKTSYGDVLKVYSDEKNTSTRSMYSSVSNLCKKDPSFKDHPAVKNIISEAEALGAHEIITGIYPEATILKSSHGCNEIILSNADYSYVYEILSAHGFEAVNISPIEGAKMDTSVLRKKSDLVTIYWYKETKDMRIMWENVSNTDLDLLVPNDKTGTGSIQNVSVGIERVTERDNPLNGICNITKLSDGTAIILDGGMNNVPCAKNIYDSLGKLGIAKNEKGQYIIREWIFSHYHGDHTGTIQEFSSLYGNTVEVMYIMHAFAGESKAAGNGGSLASNIASFYPNAQYINPHGGIKYYFGNVTISMLYTPDMLYSYSGPLSYDNDTSIIYKLEGGEASALFYGDSGEEASKIMWNSYDSSAFKSDILQITHHGLYTEANNRHGWTYLKKVYDATEATYAILPMHSKYGPDARNGRFTVMIQWCNAGYQISYVMNEKDNHGKNSISQDYYNQFVESVKNGTNTYDTLYGYDGINKIVSENGLITYTAGNNYTPMVTIFELGDGKVTPTLNEELYIWLGVNNS